MTEHARMHRIHLTDHLWAFVQPLLLLLLAWGDVRGAIGSTGLEHDQFKLLLADPAD